MSIIKSFPGYEFLNGENIYRGTNLGKGGYIISSAGIYTNVALLDIQSLHPTSIINMNYFGKYTEHYKNILDARILIKHGDLEGAKKILGDKYGHYLNDPSTAKDWAQALKIGLNSCYGLTAASFPTPLLHPMNKNNIVALRGSLFMRTLQDEVESRGYKIVAIKTDSIKIADVTKEIVDFCMEFARKYGYVFEHEAVYEKMCQINDADYVAKYKDPEWCEKTFGYIPGDNKKHPGEWTVTGAQFAVPYVFKTLFSKEPIEFDDLCETKSVKSAIYLDMNENLPDVSDIEKDLAKAELQFKNGKITEEEWNTIYADTIPLIAEGHDYKFVGKVGQFSPIKPGYGGGLLMREQGDKLYAVTGSSGYRWLESEMIRGTNEDIIDKSYYNRLVDDAVEAISQYGDFEWFVSDDPVPKVEPKLPGILDKGKKPPCGDCKFETCYDCPKFYADNFHADCQAGYDLSGYLTMN